MQNHIEEAQRPQLPFSEGAIDALQRAGSESIRARGVVTPDHVLVGILATDAHIAERLHHVLPARYARDITHNLFDQQAGEGHIQHNPFPLRNASMTDRVLDQTQQIATEEGANQITTLHMLNAILQLHEDPKINGLVSIVLNQRNLPATQILALLVDQPAS